MIWDNEKIWYAIEVLGSSMSVYEAALSISAKYDVDISVDALGKAFKRHGFNAPSTYLKDWRAEEQVSEIETTEESTSNVFDYYINFEERTYRFFFKDSLYTLTFDDMEQACFLYSGVQPGQNLTARQVTQYFMIEKGYEAISEEFISWMFKRIGFFKEMSPAAPHQRFTTVEEIAQSMAVRQDAMMKSSLKVRQIKEQQKEIRRLTGIIENYNSVLDLCDKINGITFKSFDYSGVEPVPPEFSRGTKILGIGDVHAGKNVPDHRFKNMNNIYNREEFQRRIKLIASYIRQEGAGDSEKGGKDLFILTGLGDWFESLLFNMREGMFRDTYGTPEEQYDDVIWAFCTVLKAAEESYSCPIRAFYVPGNHDRLARNKEDKSEHLVAHSILQTIRAKFEHCERVVIEKGADVNSIMLPNEVNYIFFHGHIGPLSPSSTDKDYTNFVAVHGYPGARRYLLQAGHFHTFTVKTFFNGRMVWVPAVCGNDYYSVDHIAKGSPAEIIFLDSLEIVDQVIGPYPLVA
jgi:hypothetical protein